MIQKPYLVGLTGGSASGKTRFLKELAASFGPDEVCVLSQDNYYKTADYHIKDENGHINFDLPECIDLDRFSADIDKLSRGEEVKIQEYRFQHETQYGDWLTFKPAKIIIAEGLFIFYRKDIFHMFDLKLFIDANPDIQYERRLKRDTQERNIPADFVKYQWDNHVMPSFNQYLQPYKDQADVIININTHFLNSLRIIEDHFKRVLNA